MAYFNRQAQNSHDFEKIDVFISHEKGILAAGSLEEVWLLHKALKPWHFLATVFMVRHSSSRSNMAAHLQSSIKHSRQQEEGSRRRFSPLSLQSHPDIPCVSACTLFAKM